MHHVGVYACISGCTARRKFASRAVTASVVAAFVVVAAVGDRARGATSNSTVSVTVGSASWIDAAGCATGTADVTVFGTVLPATSNVTASDCQVKFGSSNDTAMLRAYRPGGAGSAMWLPSAGAADTAFAGTGMVVTPRPANQWIYGFAVQPDGKAVLGGGSIEGSWDFILLRYNTNGTLDASLGGTGIVTTDVGAATGDRANAIALAPDGKIALAGYSGTQLAVVRYDSGGALDASFGGTGKVTTAVGATSTMGHGAAVAADGKVVVVGEAVSGANIDFVVVRYLSNGVLDTSFGGTGTVTTSITAGADRASAVVLQPDGKLVVSGSANNNAQFVVARYNTDGTLDTSFGGTGIVSFTFGGAYNEADDVRLQADGKPVVAGSCSGGSNNDFCVARLSTAGALDPTFDTDGKLTASPVGFEHDWATGLAILDDGRLLVGGYCRDAGYNEDFCALRLTIAGALDTTFDGDGRLVLPDDTTYLQPFGIALAPGGELMMGGTCYVGLSNDDACVASYASGGSVSDYVDNGTADWDTGGSISLFGACLRSVVDGAVSGGTAWTAGPAGTCPMTDGAYWNAIPAGAPGTKVAYVSTSDPQGGGTDPTANIRFGFRARSDQPAGIYTAPIVFEAIAPNV